MISCLTTRPGGQHGQLLCHFRRPSDCIAIHRVGAAGGSDRGSMDGPPGWRWTEPPPSRPGPDAQRPLHLSRQRWVRHDCWTAKWPAHTLPTMLKNVYRRRWLRSTRVKQGTSSRGGSIHSPSRPPVSPADRPPHNPFGIHPSASLQHCLALHRDGYDVYPCSYHGSGYDSSSRGYAQYTGRVDLACGCPSSAWSSPERRFASKYPRRCRTTVSSVGGLALDWHGISYSGRGRCRIRDVADCCLGCRHVRLAVPGHIHD
jgi:hypothetical protein